MSTTRKSIQLTKLRFTLNPNIHPNTFVTPHPLLYHLLKCMLKKGKAVPLQA